MPNTPTRLSFIPYGRQWIDEEDVEAISDVMRSDWLTTGPCVQDFEEALADRVGAKHAIAVSSGTAALHVAMLAADLKKGDRVLTSTNTFIASANAAAFVGATPDFVDIDPQTYTMSSDALEKQWTEDVRAVVPVAFAGQTCDMPRIAKITQGNNALVIEDASHALGGFLCDGKDTFPVGGHRWADMTTFSFHPVKTITTGEGGAITTNNDELAEKCRRYRNHGMTKDRETFTGLGESSLDEFGPWYYEMNALGYNYRITDIQCALGLQQLKKLNAFVERRAEIVAAYNKAFSSLESVTTPHVSEYANPAWHIYVVQIDFEKVSKSRTHIMKALQDLGIGTQVHYIPVHLQPFYRENYGYKHGKCPTAEAYYRQCLSLPLYAAMKESDVTRVIEAVKTVLAPAP